MSIEVNDYEIAIRESYIELINKYKHLSNLLYLLNKTNKIYIFGGWLRDILHNYFHNDSVSWQDVDIVVDGQINEKCLPTFTRSNFGGYRFNFAQNKKTDFWELKKTLAFKLNLLPISVENIIMTTVFNMNALLFDITTYRLMGDNAIEDIKNKYIRFNCKEYLDYYPELQVYRAYYYSEKLGYKIDNEIIRFAKKNLYAKNEVGFLNLILKHKSWVSLEEIEQLYSFYNKL